MKEWLYQVFVTTGSIDAYLLLKELDRNENGGEKNEIGTNDDGGRGNY